MRFFVCFFFLNPVDVNHGVKEGWRRKWSGSGGVDPLLMREGYLCERGERSSLGYEAG